MGSLHPTVKDLVLVGGGHTHAIVLKLFAMRSIPGVRLTLITEASHTPYSGMLPGHIAGLYSYDECHIDLRSLAQFAQAQFLVDQVIGLDLKQNRVLCANHPPVAFDLVSINIGSTPATPLVPGASEYTTPIKPVSRFLANWNQLVEQLTQAPDQPLRLGVVGGGAGGVELSLAMQYCLHQILKAAGQPTNLEMHLFHRDAELMPTYNRWVRQRFNKTLTHRGIKLHLQEAVSQVQPHQVRCDSGLAVKCDRIFWVTQASAPVWLQEAGLATDSNGFVQVHDTLQSISHPQAFAAGDVAAVINHPRPKAGVFAVRQGQPLFQNLRRALLSRTLKPFIPQRQFLSLISTGNPSAIASRGPFALESPLLWRWKDRIDRQFMARFSNLPAMTSGWINPALVVEPKVRHDLSRATMRCSGCGAKVGSTTLERVLRRVSLEQPYRDRENLVQLDENQSNILIGLDAPDDAAVVRVPADQVMVHSVDYFRAIIDDPFVFGQIAANHCLSDIFAMGAMPQSALAIAVVPYALEAKLEETLYQLLSGAIKVLHQAQTPLVGGHTTEGAELALGLSCNGLAHPSRLLRKGGMQPGQVLILTKALGTGTLFAATMRLKAKGRWIDDAIQSMLLSNQAAAACFSAYGATACTDITGFGLLGHLMEMIQASYVSVELNLGAIPLLDGAQETLQMGFVSSLQPQNLRASQNINNLSEVSSRRNFPILFDPQTSGGLLAAIPQARADSCLGLLKSLGYLHSSIIGYVVPLAKDIEPIKILS